MTEMLSDKEFDKLDGDDKVLYGLFMASLAEDYFEDFSGLEGCDG